MALSVILRGTHKFSGLSNVASKLIATKPLNTKIMFTPIVTRAFTGFNRSAVLNVKKAITNTQITQSRTLTHSQIWAMEKILSVALLGIIPTCLLFPNPILDNILAVAVVIHMHWGVESVVVDYIRPVIFGNVIPKFAKGFVFAVSAITLGGLIYFNFNDIGCARAVKRIWAVGKKHEN